jgi:hypothetical protein
MPLQSSDPRVDRLVPYVRLERYEQVVGPDRDAVDALYRWCQELSLSLFADIAALEVFMRSAMARELRDVFGIDWYARHELFDDHAARMITSAWRHGGLQRLADDPTITSDVVEGKLVANLMFGFWVKILGKGSWAGKPPLRQRRIYDTLLWRPALKKAFPHTKSRRDVERHATMIQVTRNRIAHHEHIAWGISLPGQRRRVSVSEVRTVLLELASFLSPDAEAWIDANSSVVRIITECPADPTHLRL